MGLKMLDLNVADLDFIPNTAFGAFLSTSRNDPLSVENSF